MRLRSVLFIIGFLVYSPQRVLSQPGSRILESISMPSKVLRKDIRYSVYLPADYQTSARAYPVVYLLHGLGDDETAWIQNGEIKQYVDLAMADGRLPSFILVMPDAGRTWYIDSFDGKSPYEQFFIQEFIPCIEQRYRVRKEKRFRGIAGLSMGGAGSLYYAVVHPSLFIAAASLSAAVRSDSAIVQLSPELYRDRFSAVYGLDRLGVKRLTPYYRAHSVLDLIENKSGKELSQVEYWIDCGDKDYLIEGNCLLHLALGKKQVPHEFRVRAGQHSWPYWRSGITDALIFISSHFH